MVADCKEADEAGRDEADYGSKSHGEANLYATPVDNATKYAIHSVNLLVKNVMLVTLMLY